MAEHDDMQGGDFAEALERLTELVRQSSKIVAFTGAGISTESGIPDFRSPGGVWEKFDPNEFTIQRFVESEESRRKHWLRSSAMYAQILASEPNPAHLALARLEKMGRLRALITQNVDGLHQRAGSDPAHIIELHGNTTRVGCLSCEYEVPREEFQPLVSPAGDAPPCPECGGLMKPATISFGQSLKPDSLVRAAEAAQDCDLFLVIGSSLVVYPAAEFPLVARRQGAELAILNLQETPHDPHASVVIQAVAGEVMQSVLRAVEELAAPLAPPLPN